MFAAQKKKNHSTSRRSGPLCFQHKCVPQSFFMLLFLTCGANLTDSEERWCFKPKKKNLNYIWMAKLFAQILCMVPFFMFSQEWCSAFANRLISCMHYKESVIPKDFQDRIARKFCFIWHWIGIYDSDPNLRVIILSSVQLDKKIK